jgi:hypothetical protein
MCKPAVGPKPTPVLWFPTLSLGYDSHSMKLTTLHLILWSKMSEALPPWIHFMMWRFGRGTFYCYLWATINCMSLRAKVCSENCRFKYNLEVLCVLMWTLI